MTESFAREHFAHRIKIGWLGLNLSKEQTQIPHSQTLYGSHLRCLWAVEEGDISLSCHLLQKPFSTSTGLWRICRALSKEAKFWEISYHVFGWQVCYNSLIEISSFSYSAILNYNVNDSKYIYLMMLLPTDNIEVGLITKWVSLSHLLLPAWFGLLHVFDLKYTWTFLFHCPSNLLYSVKALLELRTNT